MAYKI